jgi:sugar phosphate isomerase/epimerase
MKFGLLSVTSSGLFYKGEALSIEQQIHKAKKLGFDGLSIEAKRPIASPLDLSKSDRTRIKSIAEEEGIELCAIESLSNFSSSFMEERENNLAMMRLTLELAADLGISLVKIFAAWPGIINDEEEVAVYGPFERGAFHKRLYPDGLRKWHRVVSGIREIADLAKDMGITLALQNHAPVITPGYEDVLAMKQELDHGNVKICLDVPLFYDRQNVDYILEAVRMCADDIVLSHYGAWNFIERNGKVVQIPASSFGGLINYESFITELHKINYTGYLVSEYCLPVLENHKVAGIEAIDLATSRGLRYIKDLVHKTSALSIT